MERNCPLGYVHHKWLHFEFCIEFLPQLYLSLNQWKSKWNRACNDSDDWWIYYRKDTGLPFHTWAKDKSGQDKSVQIDMGWREFLARSSRQIGWEKKWMWPEGVEINEGIVIGMKKTLAYDWKPINYRAPFHDMSFTLQKFSIYIVALGLQWKPPQLAPVVWTAKQL